MSAIIDDDPDHTLDAGSGDATRWVVAVYLTQLAYGGPEEGGWWYDTGQLVRVMRVFRTLKAARAYNHRLNRRLDATLNKGRRPKHSVLSDGVYEGDIHPETAPAWYPAERPHYE